VTHLDVSDEDIEIAGQALREAVTALQGANRSDNRATASA
jgi:hypothetical protein